MNLPWLSICVALILVSCSRADDEPIQGPMDGWAVSSPEEQGMEGSRLSALDSSLADEHGNIDAMVVIRNGRVVYEKHYSRDYDDMNEGRRQAPGVYNYHDPEWHPYYQRGELHTMQSVTKSVTSALVGIAIGRGEIAGVDVRVIDFLDGYDIANLDEWKRSMTLQDLLTMRAGLRHRCSDVWKTRARLAWDTVTNGGWFPGAPTGTRTPLPHLATGGSDCSSCRSWIWSPCSPDGTSMMFPLSTRASPLTPFFERCTRVPHMGATDNNLTT
jgi:CubicO group peptidase (beta-lactamase class C family)